MNKQTYYLFIIYFILLYYYQTPDRAHQAYSQASHREARTTIYDLERRNRPCSTKNQIPGFLMILRSKSMPGRMSLFSNMCNQN